METKEKRTQVLAGLLALAGLLGVWTLATAGDLEPNSPPAPTMKTLDEIYDAAASVSEREGYMQSYEVDPCSSETFFTVPAGKQFVLMKLYLEHRYLSLTVNDNLFIGGRYFFGTLPNAPGTYVDFSDRCTIVNAGETLKVVNDYDYSLYATIVGYFYDVE